MNLLGRPEDHDPNDVWVAEDATRSLGGGLHASLRRFAEPPPARIAQGVIAPDYTGSVEGRSNSVDDAHRAARQPDSVSLANRVVIEKIAVIRRKRISGGG